jgi:hypothetical protein
MYRAAPAMVSRETAKEAKIIIAFGPLIDGAKAP